MKMYTEKEVEQARRMATMKVGLLITACFVVLVGTPFLVKNQAMVFLVCAALCSIVIGFVWRAGKQPGEFFFVGNSFILDKEGKVLEYITDARWVLKKEIDDARCSVLAHELWPIVGWRQLQIVVNDKILTVRVSARAFCHAKKHQLYFDKFLRRAAQDEKIPMPQEIIDNLLAVFLRQQEAEFSGIYNAQVHEGSLEFELIVGDRLADYLTEELVCSALHLDSVECRGELKASLIS